MKIKHQLLFIICSVVIILGVLSYKINSSIKQSTQTLLDDKLIENKEIAFKKVIEIHESPVKTAVADYTIWDQSVDFLTGKKDNTWAKEELDLVLVNYKNLDYIWVLNNKGEKFYTSTTKKETAIKELNIPTEAILTKLKENPFTHFYIKDKTGLIEIFTAPVQPTNDNERKTLPYGYFLFGKIMDSSYLNNMRSINGEFKINIADKNSMFEDKILEKSSSIQFSVPLKDYTNNVVASLNVQREYKVLKTYQGFVNKYLLLFIVLTTLIGFVFFYFLKSILFEPLNKIGNSFKQQTPEKLEQLAKKSTEYGQLARLIINFFDQNKKLKEEFLANQKMQIKLQNANSEKLHAEHSAKAKSQFLSTMSHEIRTPINGVIGISNLLMEEKLTEKQKDYVNTLQYSANHLLSVVSDILDFSKIESGNLEFESAPFELNQICKHAFNLFAPSAESKNLQYKFIPNQNTKLSLIGDQTRLNQVLTNLLGNAIKFTNNGKVSLKYNVEKETETHATILFEIKDSGIGIAENRRHKVFESFSQADSSINRKYGGTGLGLTITKKIIELQNGTIDFESEENKGTVFFVRLTFEKNKSQKLQIPEDAILKGTGQNLEGMHILIAEDNAVNIIVLTNFLKKWKISYTIANNGEEAVEQIKKNNYDLVLMDVQMPKMNGLEATQLIRASLDERINKTPIIALTADALVDTHRNLLQHGFNNTITKPFNPEQLFNEMEKHSTKVINNNF